MQTIVPNTSVALKALAKADFITQWRNRRSVVLVLLVPVIILVSWKGAIDQIGASFALSSCITIGLTAIGLMGYSNAIARDRDKGVFQRLRVAPVATWSIMLSRLIVQLFMILLTTSIVFIAGYYFDHILLHPINYVYTFLNALVGGAVYLGLGQMIVGLVKNAETVNSTTRLVYFVFIMVGMFGEFGVLGNQVKQLVIWSPYGTVKSILAASMEPLKWTSKTSLQLAVTLFYAIIFSFVGIKNFKWNSNR